MDEMQLPDIAVMNKFTEFGNIISWQQTREIMLAALRPYLKKKDTTAQELLPLPIDDIDKEKGRTDVTKEEMDWWKKVKEQFKKES